MPDPGLPPLEALDAVLFDAGGTLLELDHAFIARCVGRHGHRVTRERLRRGEVHARRQVDAEARGASLAPDARRRASYFERLLEGAEVPAAARGPVVAALETAHTRANLWRVAMEGAAATLAGLRARGLRTAVVSNADGRVEALLAAAALAPHLDLVVDSHHEGVEKPDPEIFRRALDRLGVPASRALYVGDIHAVDVVGARAAGLVPVLLDPLAAYAGADCARLPRLTALLGRPDAPEGRGRAVPRRGPR